MLQWSLDLEDPGVRSPSVVQGTGPARVVARVGALGLCDPWTRV